MTTKSLGPNFKVIVGPDGKTSIKHVKRFYSVSARLAAKKKKTWKPTKCSKQSS